MSLGEIFEEIPKLTLAQREELIRRLVSFDDGRLSDHENALLNARMEDFRQNPDAGIPLEQLKEHVTHRLSD